MFSVAAEDRGYKRTAAHTRWRGRRAFCLRRHRLSREETGERYLPSGRELAREHYSEWRAPTVLPTASTHSKAYAPWIATLQRGRRQMHMPAKSMIRVL